MHALAAQREACPGQRTGQRLALAGGHLDHVALQQAQCALQLDVEGAHPDGAVGDLAQAGQQLWRVIAVVAGAGDEIGVRQFLQLRLECGGARHQRHAALLVAALLAPEGLPKPVHSGHVSLHPLCDARVPDFPGTGPYVDPA